MDTDIPHYKRYNYDSNTIVVDESKTVTVHINGKHMCAVATIGTNIVSLGCVKLDNNMMVLSYVYREQAFVIVASFMDSYVDLKLFVVDKGNGDVRSTERVIRPVSEITE